MSTSVLLHTGLPGAHGGQKRVLDPIELELQTVVSWWDSNPDPLEEQLVLLTTEI